MIDDMFTLLVRTIRILSQEISGRDRETRTRVIMFLISLVLSLWVGILVPVIINLSPKQNNFDSQIRKLNDVETSLKGLIAFVEDQKKAVSESHVVVTQLKEEEKVLRPVVEADRKMVDAVLQAQAARQQSRVWIERIVSFLLGVMSSIVASFIYTALRGAIHQRKNNTANMNPTTPPTVQ